MFFKFKRLKIVEQIAVVFFLAVLIPMTISGFIINNINQQTVRSQLREYAVLIANMVSDEIDFFAAQNKMTLNQIAFTLNYLQSEEQKNKFFNDIKRNVSSCDEISIVKYQSDLDELIKIGRQEKKSRIVYKVKRRKLSCDHL